MPVHYHISNLPYSQHRPLTALPPLGRCSSLFLRPWASSEWKHNSAIWAVGYTSAIYCHYVSISEVGTKLHFLVTEARVWTTCSALG